MIPIDSTAASGRYQKHCPGCFQLKDGAPVCPHCGYDESSPRSPLFLPHGMILGGQYRVGRVLGRPGGFGITYLGWDINLQQRVAIKEYLPRELGARTPEVLDVYAHTPEDRRGFEFGKEQFLREARIVAKLDHPNVVRVRNFFNAHSTAYLVMDYYEGMSLGDYLTTVRTRLEPELAIPLVKPILDGLQYVHERGLVHRDLKPHNVYLAAVGRPIVLDFGAARQAAGDRVQSLSVVLTEGYAPLEQYQRRAIQGPWTDVYGVAATLYRMIAGHAPPIALDRIGADPVENGGWASIPEGLVPAMRRALAVRPNERFQTASDFRAALEQFRTAATASTAPPLVEPPLGSRVRLDADTKPRSMDRAPVADAPVASVRPAPADPELAVPPPAAVVMPRAVPLAPAAPVIPAVPALLPSTEAESAHAGIRRPAEGYPLLGSLSDAGLGAPPAPAEPPPTALPPAAPLYRRVDGVAPGPSALSQPPPELPRRRAADRRKSLPSRLLLLLIGFAGVLAVLYVLLNPPGTGSAPAAPATAAPEPAPVATGSAGIQAATETPPPPAIARDQNPPEVTPVVEVNELPLPAAPPATVALPAGELPVVGNPALLALRSFRIGVTEVTVGQFGDFVRLSGYRNPRWQNYPCESAGGRLPEWDAPGYAQGADYPVVCVSWADANAYAQWLSRETGLRYRLPTEAEWEYAARAGTRGRYWWGNEVGTGMVACSNCAASEIPPSRPLAVRSFPANPFGLYEVLGNAREWTCSPHLANAVNARCGTPDENARVAVRGGSWQQGRDALDIGRREAFEPYRRNVWTGFRIVQEIPGN